LSSTPSNRPLWIAIALLTLGLTVTLTLLLSRGDEATSTTDQAPAPSGPTATKAPQVTQAPTTTSAEPTQYKGPGNPSPFGDTPEEKETKTRLLLISRALDLHFQKHYDFPDRLEALIATDLLKPRDLDDPWRRPVDYTRVARERFKLCSRGKDATSFTDDDICIGPGGRAERPGHGGP
jgi:hypothetical protein